MRSAPYEARGGLRTVWGSYLGSGAIDKPGSSDWSITRTAVGVYVIRFFPAFRSPPELSFGPTGYILLGASQSYADWIEVRSWIPNTSGGQDTGGYFRAEGRALV